ncbi:MAG: DUF4065 domain-containing protein [Firmicutes bacterium]|nr:DUF4065 domain-containing protein [Bacillota bacterium]
MIDLAEEILSNYEPSLFSGFRKFNPDKIQEMAVLIANEAANLSKTKLMKLFFYSDFCHFKNNGVSISGLRYAHLPSGPVVNNYNTLFTWLEWQKAISFSLVDTGGFEWESISSSQKPRGILGDEEMKSLKHVLRNLSELTAGQLSNYSHKEKAYTKTTIGELISYEHALALNL